MKHLRKFLAALLALAVVLSVSAIVFAETPSRNPLTTYDATAEANLRLVKYAKVGGFEGPLSNYNGVYNPTIEQENAIHAIAGVTFTYYKMADVVVEENGAVYYTIPTTATELMGKVGVTAADAVKSEGGKYYFTYAKLNEMLISLNSDGAKKTALEEYIGTKGENMPVTDVSGVSEVKDLDHGMYLIAETGLPTDPAIITETFAPFYVPLPLQTEGGWEYNVTVYPKNKMELNGPNLTKKVGHFLTGVLGKTTPQRMGANLNYEITSLLPEIGTKDTYLNKYIFTDTIEKGLKYTGTNDDPKVTVKVDGTTWTLGTDYAVNYGTNDAGNSTMTITVLEAGLTKINENYVSGMTMKINYSCSLTTEAVLGDDGNPNEVKLDWSRENGEEDDEKDCCHVYTYGLDITKIFSDNSDATDFTGVVFTIEMQKFSAPGEYSYVIVRDGSVGTTSTESDEIYYTPDKDGKIVLRGLPPATYRITEIATKDGYYKISDSIEVVITSEESATTCENDRCKVRVGSATVDGNAATMLEDGVSVNALATITVYNHPKSNLPPTGAEGTWLLSIVGILAMAAAAFVIILVCRKKKTTDEN